MSEERKKENQKKKCTLNYPEEWNGMEKSFLRPFTFTRNNEEIRRIFLLAFSFFIFAPFGLLYIFI